MLQIDEKGVGMTVLYFEWYFLIVDYGNGKSYQLQTESLKVFCFLSLIFPKPGNAHHISSLIPRTIIW